MSTEVIDPTGIRMTLSQLRARQVELKDRQILLVENHEEADGRHKVYWRSEQNGYTRDIMEAGHYTVEYAIRQCYGDYVTYELVEEPVPNPNPDVKRILISQAVARGHSDKIGNKMCRVVSTHGMHDGMYWKKPTGTGVTWNKEEAVEMRVSTVITAYEAAACLIEMLDQETAEEISKLPYRRLVFEEHIPSSLIQSLKLYPQNPTYRAMLLARFKVMPPDELKTFDEIKDWVEFNCDPPAAKLPPSTQRPRLIGVDVALNFRRDDVGNAQYSASERGTGNFMIRDAELLAEAANAQSMGDLMERIRMSIERTNPWHRCTPQMHHAGDYEYSDHDSDHTENREWTFESLPNARNAISDRLRALLVMPEDLARLGLLQPEPLATIMVAPDQEAAF